MQLNKAFDKEQFIEFLKGFLPDDFELDEKELKIFEYWNNFKFGLLLGESKTLGLKVFYLEHEKERDPRVALTAEAFRILSDNWSKKALVVINSRNSDNWRLSLMTAFFDINEKNKVVTNLSNPKRKSFFLGPNAKIATANQFLLKKDRVADFDDLESRFDVEVVTKEFFENYKKLFIKLFGYLKDDRTFNVFACNNKIKLDDFAKKLLGQIVFIYFLQKKGWLGAKKGEHIYEGDPIFLRSLYSKCEAENKNFFNDCLEPLFYNAFNKESEKAGSFYREYFDCQIPFLNGGLFEPLNKYDWEKEFLHIPNNLFSNDDKTGILDIFDLYNFTIDENSTIDQEVSVDPEMLGKVFEKLLDTNKETGSFYTPREIVAYMVKQSLIEYLKTKTKVSEKNIEELVNHHHISNADLSKDDFKSIDQALKEIKIIDPAVGSGAFPVGILQEMTEIRSICQANISNKPKLAYDIKREILENNIYGVDIDHGAIDIARLRFWLSLVVDADLNDVEPLPNLDFKLTAANTLLKLDGEEGLYDERGLLENMRELREKYFRARTKNGKEKNQNDFKKLIKRSDNMFATDRQKQIMTYDPFSPSQVAQFFDPEFMFGVKEFDLVIGNPPYIDSETMVKTGQIKYREKLSKQYKTTNGNWDLFIPFIEKGILLNGNNGILSFIIPNKLISQDYSKSIRELILSNSVIEIRDYSRIPVFLSVSVYPITIILKKEVGNSEVKMIKMDDLSTKSHSISIDKKEISNKSWDIYFNDKNIVSIIEKLNTCNGILSDLAVFESPCTVSEAYSFKEVVLDGVYTNDSKKLINSGTIDPYISLWGIKDTSYIKEKYKRPIISKADIKNINERRLSQAESPKVIIANMTNEIEAFLDINANYLAGKSTSICLGDKDNLKVVVFLLNSKLISFWYKTTLHSTKMSGGALSISPKKLEVIPIPSIGGNERLSIISKVDKILEITLNENYDYKNPPSEQLRLEKDIDKLVYELYGLTEEEIKIVEGN